jgi:hypothetical protein
MFTRHSYLSTCARVENEKPAAERRKGKVEDRPRSPDNKIATDLVEDQTVVAIMDHLAEATRRNRHMLICKLVTPSLSVGRVRRLTFMCSVRWTKFDWRRVFRGLNHKRT